MTLEELLKGIHDLIAEGAPLATEVTVRVPTDDPTTKVPWTVTHRIEELRREHSVIEIVSPVRP